MLLVAGVVLVGCGGDDDDGGDAPGDDASGVIADVEELADECRDGADDVVQCSDDDLAGFDEVCSAVAPPDVGEGAATGFLQARPEGADFEAVVDCTFDEPRAHVGIGIEGEGAPRVCETELIVACEEIGGLDVGHGGDLPLFLTSDAGVSVRVDSVDLDDEQLATYAAAVFATVLGVSLDPADLAALASGA